MSATATATATPPADDLDRHLALYTQAAFVPVFFNKLAALGVSPQTDAEAEQLLAIGEKVLAVHQAEQTKAAADGTLAAVAADLDVKLAEAAGHTRYDRAADELLAAVPGLAESVLAYKQAQAAAFLDGPPSA